jgi:hypothetical protein
VALPLGVRHARDILRATDAIRVLRGGANLREPRWCVAGARGRSQGIAVLTGSRIAK